MSVKKTIYTTLLSFLFIQQAVLASSYESSYSSTCDSYLSEVTSDPGTALKLEPDPYNLVGVTLFSGTDPFSKLIKTFTKSKFSHVGAILCRKSLDSTDMKNWESFEATGSAGEVLHGHMPDVRISSWVHNANEYSGGVSYRTLNILQQKDESTVQKFFEEFNGRPYEKDLTELLWAPLQENRKNDLKSVFCSELVAELFRRLNLLPAERLADNYVPNDFSEMAHLQLTNALLNNEIVFKKHKGGCCVLL